MRLSAVAAFALIAATSAFAATPTIDKVEAKLFYQGSGTLSVNVATGSNVALWNTMIGAGDVEEPASDTLAIVTIAADPDSYIETPLTIEVTDNEGKVLVTRTITGLLVGESGKVSRAVFVQDSTCTPLTITATFGTSTSSTAVHFACGE